MIGIKDIETEVGNEEFEEYRKTTERFIRSKVFSGEDSEDLVQETIRRVWQKLSEDENWKVNAGYFIATARNVLFEYYRRKTTENKLFENPTDDEENGFDKPPDAGSQVKKYADHHERSIINACMLECFNECNSDEQILLWRYSFDERYRLDDEESDSNENLLQRLLDVVREIRDKFLPLQDGYSPITENVRVRISRLRSRLRNCVMNCISRKKGFA